MSCSAKVILASEYKGSVIWTLQLRYWRAFHAEFMTHRVFSRNASSSRAIPVERMLDTVINDTAGPEHWGANQMGMQAASENLNKVEIPGYLWSAYLHFVTEPPSAQELLERKVPREVAWKFSAWLAAQVSRSFADAGYHKQVSNRLTEPYQYINVVVTGTQWDNFFELRDHKDAMPEFQHLARSIKHAMEKHDHVQRLEVDQWHIPYIHDYEQSMPLEHKLALSTARCASVSYRTVEGKPMTLDRALEIFQKLVGSRPWHASPTEHQAQAKGTAFPQLHGNLGAPWAQYRKYIELGQVYW